MSRAVLSTLRSGGVADSWSQTRTVGLLATVAGLAQAVVGILVLPTDAYAQTAVVGWGGMMLAALGTNLLRDGQAIPSGDRAFGSAGTAVWTLGTAVIVFASLALILPV